MMTDRIKRHKALLPVNHDHYNFRKNKYNFLRKYLRLRHCLKKTLQNDQRKIRPGNTPITLEEVVMVMIDKGNGTEWNPIWSLNIRVINKNRTTAKRESELSIISRLEVLLPINHNHYNFRKKG